MRTAWRFSRKRWQERMRGGGLAATCARTPPRSALCTTLSLVVYLFGCWAFGVQIQIWLTLGYDANGQRAEALELYKKLEDEHPLKEIRKQAAELRYILEAPELEISAEERVSIPLADGLTQYRRA